MPSLQVTSFFFQTKISNFFVRPTEKEFIAAVKAFYQTFGSDFHSLPQFQQNPVFFGMCEVQHCYEVFHEVFFITFFCSLF